MIEFQHSKPPNEYVPAFCSAVFANIKSLFDSISSTSSETLIKLEEKSKEVSKNMLFLEKKMTEKIINLESQFHLIDKEMYKVQDIYQAMKDQSNLNVEMIEQFKSLDSKFKILFRIILIILVGNLSLAYFFIKTQF